jgi:sugar O-acyltransferase (sialic acid O-acetyltransferase NeuD family)
MQDLMLIGGGGHCASCIEVIESSCLWRIVGIIDMPGKLSEATLGYAVIGTDDDMPSMAKTVKHAIVTIGQIGSAEKRKRLYEVGLEAGFSFPAICASTGIVSRHSSIGDGTIVMHRASVNAEASVGKNCIVNTGAIIEHGAVVGNHCHISTGAIVNGECIVGDGSFIGSGAVIKHGVRVGARCIVGAGAVVIENLTEIGTYVGCPARRIG